MPSPLAELEARIARELASIAHPSAPWLEPHIGPDGQPALDVLIVGAGQGGSATAFGLLRSRVDNILAIDAAPAGLEGPWNNYARMHTLRNPKDYTGPDLDIPSLTVQSWYSARFGEAAWEALFQLPRQQWAEYLLWVRRVTGVPVENGCRLLRLGPVEGSTLLAAEVESSATGRRTLYARKVVLATGQEGVGRWSVPDSLAALPQTHCVNSSQPVDFAALKGKTVVVIGAGASAFDNAATALEAGAAEVQLLCRRLDPQVVQPYRWLTFRGFLRHLSDLEDAWRWRFMRHVLAMREGFPQPTYDRCAVHENFELRSGCQVLSSRLDPATGRVVLETNQGPLQADFVISATGIENDFHSKPELAACADNIATWADRYTPPAEEADARLATYPYLNQDWSFAEKQPGRTPWLRNVHLYAIGSTMSFGASGSSINAMTTAVPKLVSGLTRGLFEEDLDQYWASFRAYDVPQAVIPVKHKG
ncbi:NAD(P)-binding domain-containing protein [Xylophilus rhododendri]|uniref:NAD(P)-binding domain-containing protein n=1 Tax=Xylophilus rhododendri TaxID=2697032 RepID=A0A857JG44_9BURK|nr:NAD(P)-binding domain-containing protein [Xylophilus rhododendri]